MNAAQTPLIDLLERVPATARLIVNHDEHSSSSIPVGRLCQEAAKALRSALEQPQQSDSAQGCGGCTLSGPGRGDCEHAVGLPGNSIPGQHDGPDDTVDAYGKPNGWCWSCWKSHRIKELEAALEQPQQEPLTERECELLDGLIEYWQHHADVCGSMQNQRMGQKQRGWDLERVALLKKLRFTPVQPQQVIAQYEAALLAAFPEGASGAVYEHWNKARRLQQLQQERKT